ncbi:MAG TPA: response regulator [Gemmataceae bacterium]|jgi:CheY-like chemotaxis protein|nr:response regulator [Gemmataceae bacterium]
MRVLAADDNRDAADTLAILLRRWGHEVRVAYDGLSALTVARHFKPHVALLDIQMPRMHGGDVARNLRRQAGPDGIMVVAASATDPDDSRLARYDGVFDAYLGKPYDLDRLEELLAGCCSSAAC